MKELISKHRDSLSPTAFNAALSFQLSQRIYDILLGGITHKLTNRLLIVPYGLFYNFPFATLSLKNKYLIESKSVSTLPSINVLQYSQRKQSNKKALFVGGIEYQNYPRLPYTKLEINKLSEYVPKSRILEGGRASKINFMKVLGQYDIIHFAGHGYFDHTDPLSSGLVFSDSKFNHLLTGYEMLYNDMSCSLITMSACQTGLTNVVKSTEIFGLQRALLISGAQTILSSLWPVDDRATMELMSRFYRRLKQFPIHSALSRTQMEMLRKYPNPYYWAGF